MHLFDSFQKLKKRLKNLIKNALMGRFSNIPDIKHDATDVGTISGYRHLVVINK
jgi:hypothetical protein